MSQSISSTAAVRPALPQSSTPPLLLSLSSPSPDDAIELPKRPPSRRTSAGPAALSPQLREEAAERKQPEPQVDALTGAVLHCLSFTTGNPAVETVHGWLFVQQPPSISHPPGLRASRPELQQDDPDAQPHPSPSSTPSFSSSIPSTSPSHAVSAEAERDEKWVQVAAGKRSSKAQTVAAASPRSQQSRGRRSPSLSSSSLTRPSPSLSPLTPLPASFSSPSPLTLTAHSEEKLQEHKSLFADTRKPALALSAPLPLLPTSPPPSPSPPPAQSSSSSSSLSSSSSAVMSESALLYVFDVPSHVTIPEFQDFISEHSELVVHMQLVIAATAADQQQQQQQPASASSASASASASSSCYTVLLSFHQPSDASAFLSHYNLQLYNDIEKDVCKVAHLHHVSFDDPRYHFPFTVAPPVPPSAALPSAAVQPVPASFSSSLSSALPSHDELHICPVCLDPIHPPSASLLTILCLHHFHLHCLSLWSDSTCPVCRFSLHPPILSFCQSCSHSQPSSLWMCLTGDHLVLTRGGWRSIAAVRQGDEVLSFNVNSYAQEWKPVLAVESHAVDRNNRADDLFRMQGSGMDVLATRDHRMLLARLSQATANGLTKEEPIVYATVDQLLGLTYNVKPASTATRFSHCKSRGVVCAGFNTQPDAKVVIPGLRKVCDWWWQQDRQQAFLQFLGFWLGDGHLDVYGGYVCISQKKKQAKRWLESLLPRVFPRWWDGYALPSKPGYVVYTVRCPPLYNYLRLMAVGPLGYNPRDPQQLRSYPHFTMDAKLAAEEQQSDYYMVDNNRDCGSTWTEAEMLDKMRGDPPSSPAPRSSLSAATTESTFSQSSTSMSVSSSSSTSFSIDGDWFYLKRWLGSPAQISNVYSQVSRRQAIALLEGFCRADGTWKSIQHDGNDEPTGQWKCSNSSFPLIDHLMLIGQLAGAAVALRLHTKAGKARSIGRRRVTFSVEHWELYFTFTEPARIATAPLAQPVDVSRNKDVDKRGYYQYEDDNACKVYSIAVQDNTNFLTQRLSKVSVRSGNTGVTAHSVFVGNCLLCGHVGCSRYIGGHAFKHWEDSGHGYALSVSTQRVWDYVREEYVHRLVRTGDSNGKIVELRGGRKKAAGRRRSRRDRGGAEAAAEQEEEEEAAVLLDESSLSISLKLEDLLIEYNYLLSSQLDQQRSFYQQQLAALAAAQAQQQAAASSALASLHSRLLDVTTAVSRAEAEVAEAEREAAAAEAEGQRLRVEWEKLSAMNERLVKKQREERERAEREDRQREEEDAAVLRQKDDEIRQLEEQLRDLDFFLTTQRRVEKSGLRGDIQDGKLFVTGNEEPAADSKHDDRRTAGGAGAAGNKKKKR